MWKESSLTFMHETEVMNERIKNVFSTLLH